jgi:Peptidase family S41
MRFIGWCLAIGVLSASVSRADTPYLADFEFLATTVGEKAAAVEYKKIDWKAECARAKPKFAQCKTDVNHVKNVMELIATLRDSHTDLWETKVDRKQLPSKWKGQFGGGLWLGYDQGRFWIQGVVANHPAGPQLAPGSLLLSIDDEPAWFAMARARHRIASFSGISTDHSLFASLSNAALPFGDKTSVTIRYLTPDGDAREAQLARFGPDGQPYRYDLETLPEGVTRDAAAAPDHAIAKLLATPHLPKLGYLRITGGQNAETVKAFHAAFDTLKGMEALVLDGRGMGGGSDDAAWEMVGRLLPKGAANGRNGRIEPSGSWQFAGPVVFLQDELMVSSAETFAWAITETDRAVSVGRNTGGWGIIPNIFELPSGLAKLRIGVNARPTPIRGIQTEGVGWPADLTVPYGPVISARRDPVYDIGLEVLAVLAAGSSVPETRKLFAQLAGYELDAFSKSAAKIAAKTTGFDPKELAKTWKDDLAASLAVEKKALDDDRFPCDYAGAESRIATLLARATKAGIPAAAKAIQAALKTKATEIAAQRAFLDAADAEFQLDAAARAALTKKHGKTAFGKWLVERSK